MNTYHIFNVFNMSLLEEHKAERRARILATARKLLATRGYDGLTMRELAAEARVSVPTLYNLFGSKDAILVAEMEASAVKIARSILTSGDSFFARCSAAFDTGMRLIEDDPALFRAVTKMFLTSQDAQPMRQRVEDNFVAVMQSNLTAAKAAGQLADWAEPAVVARHIFALYMSAFMVWSMGELELEDFRAIALSGSCHLLAGVTRGPFAVEVEACLREIRAATLQLNQRIKEDRHARSSD